MKIKLLLLVKVLAFGNVYWYHGVLFSTSS